MGITGAMCKEINKKNTKKENWECGITFFSFAVCSTTLWVGQVDKKATQQDLTNLFEEFGQIESINVSGIFYEHVLKFELCNNPGRNSGMAFSLAQDKMFRISIIIILNVVNGFDNCYLLITHF